MQESDKPLETGAVQSQPTDPSSGGLTQQTMPTDSSDSTMTPMQNVTQETEISDQVGSIPVSPVVVPSSPNRVPGWFMALFVVIVVLFLAITGILVWTLKSKTSSETANVPETQKDTDAQKLQASPVETEAPTVTSVPSDNVLELLRKLNTSDDVSVISQDLDETNISFLKDDRSQLDRLFAVTSP